MIATRKPNKLLVNWLRPEIIEWKLSDTTYIVQMPGKREKYQIYHVILLKPCDRHAELVNVIICKIFYRGMNDTDHAIRYPRADPDV